MISAIPTVDDRRDLQGIGEMMIPAIPMVDDQRDLRGMEEDKPWMYLESPSQLVKPSLTGEALSPNRLNRFVVLARMSANKGFE